MNFVGQRLGANLMLVLEQCKVEFGNKLSICSRTEENEEQT